jgi:hypothetical protein
MNLSIFDESVKISTPLSGYTPPMAIVMTRKNINAAPPITSISNTAPIIEIVDNNGFLNRNPLLTSMKDRLANTKNHDIAIISKKRLFLLLPNDGLKRKHVNGPMTNQITPHLVSIFLRWSVNISGIFFN